MRSVLAVSGVLSSNGFYPARINFYSDPDVRERADNGLLDPAVAAAIERVSGVTRRGTRLGNWLTKEQANDLLNAPCSSVAGYAAPNCCASMWKVCNNARRAGSFPIWKARATASEPLPCPPA